MIIEITPIQPQPLGDAPYSLNIYVDGATSTSPTSPVYFGNSVNTPFILPNQYISLDICGVYGSWPDSTNPYFELLNFIWFDGTEIVYGPDSGINCLFFGFY